jgi:hypothetical protein
MIFRRLAQILGIRTVVRDREMIVIPARVGNGPSDDGEVVVGNFERWRFGHLDVLGPLLRRRVLSDDWAGAEQAASRGDDRQFQEQSIHETNLSMWVKLPHRSIEPVDPQRAHPSTDELLHQSDRMPDQVAQSDPRITWQKSVRLKRGSLNANTSSLTVPNVLSGRCRMPS